MTRPEHIDGVDFSHYQSGIQVDWAAAKKAGVWFLYHKATEGTNFQDPAYGNRRAEAKQHGLLFGAYHFANPAVGNARHEADFFLTTADLKPGDAVPMLDLEQTGGLSEEQLTVWVNTWFARVFQVLGVQRGFLYTHYNLHSRPKGVRLWASRYNNDNRAPVVPQPFHTWTMWQFSDGIDGTPHTVPGIPGKTDINTKRLWLRRKWMTLGGTAPAPTPTPTPVPTKHPLVSKFRLSALARFLRQPRMSEGLCLMRVRMAFGIAAKYPDAISAWNASGEKVHETDWTKIPKGYPVFWSGGSAGHGHVAIKDDWGYGIETTDLIRNGYVDRADGRQVHLRWGLTLLGYSKELNGVKIP